MTIKDAYPIPRIDVSLAQLSGMKYFSTLDLNSGYGQVEVAEHCRERTEFATRKGLYSLKGMQFGLCNAPATFERLMESVLRGVQWQICLVYLDDIIVVGKTVESMIVNLTQVFDRSLAAGLKVKARKCSLFSTKSEYFGHIVSQQGIATQITQIRLEWYKLGSPN